MALVYLAVAWTVGIWLARWLWSLGLFGCAAPAAWLWAGALAVSLVGLIAARRRPAWRLPAGMLLILLLGALRFQLSPFAPCFSPADLAFHNGSAERPVRATVTGLVLRPPEDRDTRLRVLIAAESLALGQDDEPRPVRGRALFTVDRYPGLRQGDRVTVRGSLETPPVFEDFDYQEYLARRSVHTLIQQPEARVLSHDNGSPFWRALYRVRAEAQALIARLLPEPEAGLLTGILLGVESGIDPALYDQFNRTGVSHIIVISGFNITIIAGLMTAIFARLLGPRRAFWPVAASIVLYVLLVGADAVVVRAGLMGILVVWATYLGRQSTAVVSLFAAGLAMTLANPLTLWDVGFQLSFVATLSLILFATPMTQRFEAAVRQRLPTGLAPTLLGFFNDALIVTLAATVLTLPLIAYYFGRISIVSPLTNLLVLPVQPPVMIWGGLAVIAGLPAALHPALEAVLWPLARALALIPWLALRWTVLVVERLAALPFASLEVQLNAVGLWSYFGLVGLLLLAGKPTLPLVGDRLRRAKSALSLSRLTTLSAGLLLVAGILLALGLRSQPDGQLHVTFLDLERGEAALIVTPDGQQVLIDGGFSPTELLGALGRQMPFYDRTLELVVLTHAGDERVGGLVELAQRFEIEQVLQAPFPYPSTAYESWLRALRAEGIPIAAAETGGRVLLGHGIALDVLHPGPDPTLDQAGELRPEENSLALRLSWGDTSFLLLGDASQAIQDELAASGLIRPATVVKLPQGGRQAAFSPALLDAAQPQQAVVFVQRDDRFRQLAAPVEGAWKSVVGEAGWQRTDLAGTVSFSSDGRVVTVEREKP
jgi:competence protein ComEC